MITKEQLTELGYNPKACKIGTLWLSELFFGKLSDEGVFDIRLYSDDMHTLVAVDDIEKLKEFDKEYLVLYTLYMFKSSQLKTEFMDDTKALVDRISK